MEYCTLNKDLLEQLKKSSERQNVEARIFFAPRNRREITPRGSVLLANNRTLSASESRREIAKG